MLSVVAPTNKLIVDPESRATHVISVPSVTGFCSTRLVTVNR